MYTYVYLKVYFQKNHFYKTLIINQLQNYDWKIVIPSCFKIFSVRWTEKIFYENFIFAENIHWKKVQTDKHNAGAKKYSITRRDCNKLVFAISPRLSPAAIDLILSLQNEAGERYGKSLIWKRRSMLCFLDLLIS